MVANALKTPRLLNRDVSFEAIRTLKNLYERANEFFPENPSFTFKFYTIKNKIAPLNVTERGVVVEKLMEFDGVFWGASFIV